MISDHPESPASKMEYLQRIFHQGIRRSGTGERVSVVTKFSGVGAGKLAGNEKLEVKDKVQKLVASKVW
ncbi:MAG: hypothetical protein WCA45_01160 [Thiobacillaceae bacterium]